MIYIYFFTITRLRRRRESCCCSCESLYSCCHYHSPPFLKCREVGAHHVLYFKPDCNSTSKPEACHLRSQHADAAEKHPRKLAEKSHFAKK